MTAPHSRTYTTARTEYLTVEAFGEHFGISRMAAYRLTQSGAVRYIRIGRSKRIPVSELARFAATAEEAAKTEVWELAAEEES